MYGGPGNQLVDQKVMSDPFGDMLASNGFIHVIVDGRGTGFKGRKYRSAVSKRLGKYESEDQIAAAR